MRTTEYTVFQAQNPCDERRKARRQDSPLLFVLLLHDQVGINAVFQVKERVHVPEVPAVLPGRAGAVGGWVLRVGGRFQR